MRTAIALALCLLSPGCIRRYAAPDDQAPAPTPYAALADYLEITLPDAAGSPLPKAALRLALRGETVFADAALIDGPEHAAITETWAGALALLVPRTEPIVVLAAGREICPRLAELAPRVHVAVRSGDEATGLSYAVFCAE